MTLSDPHWTSIIRVEASGMKGGEKERVIQHVIDFRDLETGFTTMNRTVRYTASIVTQIKLFLGFTPILPKISMELVCREPRR